MNAFFEAVNEGDLEKVRAMLKDDRRLAVSSSIHGTTPLHDAAARGHKAVLELLLANGAQVNAKAAGDSLTPGGGRTPLHWAAVNGHKNVVELLLAHKADVNAKTDAGETPMRLATARTDHARLAERRNAVVELLFRHGGQTLQVRK